MQEEIVKFVSNPNPKIWLVHTFVDDEGKFEVWEEPIIAWELRSKAHTDESDEDERVEKWPVGIDCFDVALTGIHFRRYEGSI